MDFANPLTSSDVLNDFDFDSFLHDEYWWRRWLLRFCERCVRHGGKRDWGGIGKPPCSLTDQVARCNRHTDLYPDDPKLVCHLGRSRGFRPFSQSGRTQADRLPFASVPLRSCRSIPTRKSRRPKSTQLGLALRHLRPSRSLIPFLSPLHLGSNRTINQAGFWCLGFYFSLSPSLFF